MQQLNTAEPEQITKRENSSYGISKINITAIADLFGYFNGNSGDYVSHSDKLLLSGRAFTVFLDNIFSNFQR